MKNKINQILLITLLSVINPLLSQAQDLFASAEPTNGHVVYSLNDKKLERAIEAYQRGLNHSMPAIVESSMFNLLVLKIDYPDTDFTSALKKLDDLCVYGKTSAVRYKALVTTEFIKNPTLFLDVDAIEFSQYIDVEKADHFYLALSKVLQNQIKPIYN
jgi:hypothetical protein